ncbi:MAG: alpha/beta hydrolase [Pseudomonadota bacterium]
MNHNNVRREFVSLVSETSARNGAGFNPCQGLYYQPLNGEAKIAFIATHYNVDFSEHYLGEYLAALGYGFLGWNTRFRGNEAFFVTEHALIDIGAGVRWLREQAKVDCVVLLGNSGGGSLMAAYQSQATTPNIRPTADLRLPDAVHTLPQGDLYISLNAHGGRPEVLTAWMDPSVVDETDPTSVDHALNMYNPEHGPPYSPEFIERYRLAQQARNHRISAWCLEELERVKQMGQRDRPFLMCRTWADLRLMDGNIDPSERPVGVCYAGDPETANFSPRGIGLTNTLRTWLSMWSLEHSECQGAKHLGNISAPALVIQSNADTGVFPSDARSIFDLLNCPDKQLEMISGDHYLTEPDNARTEVATMIHDWVSART